MSIVVHDWWRELDVELLVILKFLFVMCSKYNLCWTSANIKLREMITSRAGIYPLPHLNNNNSLSVCSRPHPRWGERFPFYRPKYEKCFTSIRYS